MVDSGFFDRGRRELLLVSIVAAFLVLVRSFTATWYEQFEFNADQAIVGLMAKHLADGRAFPLFFYGQHYMLGVQAWIAAPFVALGGPTVFMLRLPLVIINGAVAVLLIVLLKKFAGLRPVLSLAAALPFLMPTPIVASRLLQTLGASVEPFLYVLVLWALRRKPIAFGLVLAIGVLHREFTIFAIPALLAVMALEGSLFTRTTLERALTALVTIISVWIVVDLLKTKVDVYGPATGRLENGPLSLEIQSMLGRVCVEPRALFAHLRSLVVDCVPALFGARRFPLADFGMNSTLGAGTAVTGWLLVTAGVFAGVRLILVSKFSPPVGATAFPLYLGLIGVQALAVYPLSCEIIPGLPAIVRYVLLGLFVPIALAAVYLKRETVPLFRHVAVAVLVAWSAINLIDNLRVVQEYRGSTQRDPWRELVEYLEAHSIRYAHADYWDAYMIDFLSGERVIVSSDAKVRVREYQQLVDQNAARAVHIRRMPCSSGVRLVAWCIDPPPER